MRAPSQDLNRGAGAVEGLSVMEPRPLYSQVVDNASSRHFYSARGEWKKSNNRVDSLR